MTESSRGGEPALRRAISLAREALAASPAGLLTDFDGTLSPIVGDPTLARLVEGADGALAALAERLAVVGIITGRSAGLARRFIGVPGVLIVGNHGVEWLEPGEMADPPSREVATAADTAGQLDAALATVPVIDGVFLEPKAFSATIHYRNAADPAAARLTILDALRDGLPAEVDLREGRMSVELRPRGLGDKGSAARTIVERYGLRGAVVMGDDLTDLDMFRATAELRDAGRLRAAIIGVGGADREVPPEVTDAADVVLDDPAQAATLLSALSE